MKEMMRLAIIDGILRETILSCRSLRQPETTSKPSSSLSSRRMMSAGSFWRSASMGMSTAPRAASMPAAVAAGQFAQHFEARVRRAVVDVDDLGRAAEAGERLVELEVEGPQVRLLVQD